ncbi:MAG: bifunctional phosphoribosyl-AMP cyclohydrolase/phosphoribosyl-ATP diphosphatase HisIE [Thermonemataceae bacterium]|nr:bifunctional phosphoribosyl-AMP cyclohydrolase/phosphoribosyl-ATP diphosphatase HisIE [Thermonemataceae bacterium]
MQIDFSKNTEGLVPVIIQDYRSLKVLMLGYMNQEAYEKTQKEQIVTFFSRSKQRLWTKGETSGNFLKVKDIKIDCDTDTLLIKVEPLGAVCHTGADTCFEEKNQGNLYFLGYLSEIIKQRKQEAPDKSYTSSLFAKGINKIAQKVGEEAVELVIEAKDDNKELFLGEAADLLFHYLVLLEAKGSSLDEVIGVLANRHQK